MPDARDRHAWLADEFERHRPRLRGVAYRMLGSVTEADDAVQEAWIRLQRADPGGTDTLRGWLTVTVGRICLDMLRTRTSRRETYVGTWLPEPIVTPAEPRSVPNPEDATILAESVGLALLVVLDRLTPAERLAFVLHDVFAIPFEQIAPLVDRTPEATRQLASRARRRVRAEAPEPDADLEVQRRVVDAFVAAARAGDMVALLEILDPDVIFRADGGGRGPLARPPLQGAEAVAAGARLFGMRFAAYARPAIVNGEAGLIVEGAPSLPLIVAGFRIRNGRIAAMFMNGDPAKTAEAVRGDREAPDLR
jgi:RNA polymerase sigma factor (sigma-70 family)